MADYAEILAGTSMWESSLDSVEQQGSDYAFYEATTDSIDAVLVAGGGGSTITKYFKMRAQETGAVAPGYVTWIAQDAPDFLGSGYWTGTPTPAGAMVADSATVVDQWEETS
jgi:hypothetical protein